MISAIDSFDSRFDAFWEELVRQNPDKLLAARDRRTLAWHYAIPTGGAAVDLHRRPQRPAPRLLRAESAGLEPGRAPHARVDYQTLEPDVDLLPELLQAALRRCAAEGFYVLEHLGCGLPKMRSFDALRPVPPQAPDLALLLPRRRSRAGRRAAPAEAWDPSTFDGDASID